MALELLAEAERQQGATVKLGVIADQLRTLAQGNDFLDVGESIEPSGATVLYFEICGKKALFNASIKSARAIAQRLVDEYGQRALAAERNKGIDWKALSHSVRVGREALEFLTTGHITFPCPEAEHLLAIKLGQLPFEQVGEEIEQLLVDVEAAAERSSLPDTFDQRVIDDFIERLHRAQVMKP